MKKVHFIGICGAGMSGVAKLLVDQGVVVTGSDEGFYPPISDYLTKHHIPCTPHYSADNIPSDADYIVIGKHAKLTQDENEEVRAAFASGIPILSFPQVLELLTKERNRIVVAGSYGKSTCASIASWVLLESNKNPGFFIGAPYFMETVYP